MRSAVSRLGRLFGPGVMVFLLQLVALLSLGLGAGYFHSRVDLLLVPVVDGCGGPDPVARLRVAEQLLARAEALDDWQPLRWIPLVGTLLALLGAATVCALRAMPQQYRLGRLRRALVALHVGVLALAGWTLHQYEDAWSSVARLSPAACLVDLTEQGRVPLAQAQQVVLHVLTREYAPLQRNPDDLAMMAVSLLVAAMVASIVLWRAAAKGMRTPA
ncbi:MAG: hypothetical protein KH046_14315 [Stenotrophomonas maltophilia]|uniref:hypothetical protein n=1 Tax=Stenotrophomonas TaxID=40323 RepID=UPI00195369F6|nr:MULTISPECIES: hypothetical protein [Stenotrophomonas]MBS4801993.1 hypothetical protein [Stenotrophomonas maltophilia]MDG9989545.1 hypothetical protein [Stenotrophomonas sp. GD04024]